MQRLADFVESQPREKAIALIEYMDGDTTALISFQTAQTYGMKLTRSGVYRNVCRQSARELQKEYRDRKFSEYLVCNRRKYCCDAVFRHTSVSKSDKKSGIKVDKVDFDTNIDLVDSDLNGDPDFDSDFYRVIVNQGVGERSYVLMASKSLYERLDGQLPIVNGHYNVDTTQEYSFIRVDGKTMRSSQS